MSFLVTRIGGIGFSPKVTGFGDLLDCQGILGWYQLADCSATPYLILLKYFDQIKMVLAKYLHLYEIGKTS